MANQRTQWQLRYRSPLAPTKGVDDVIIETEADDPAEARTLADWWLATKVGSPSTRFVYVRRLVVATSAEMRAAQSPTKAAEVEDEPTGPSVAQAMSRDDMPDTARQEAAGKQQGGKGGRVGA